jgi:hypothetical protein
MKYKYKRPRDFWFYQIVFIIFIGFFGFILIRESINLYSSFTIKELVINLIFALIIIAILLILYQIVMIYHEYNLTDKDKEVIINDETNEVEIVQNSMKIIIKKENIKHVEIYESLRLWTYPLAYFRYINIQLTSGEQIAITSFTLPNLESNLKLILKNLKPKKHKKLFNRINQLLLTNR